MLRQFHFDGSSSRYDLLSLHGTSDDHDGIIQGSLGLSDELLSSSPQDDSRGLGFGAVDEEVVPLGSDLLLLKLAAGAEDFTGESIDGGLDDSTGGLGYSL